MKLGIIGCGAIGSDVARAADLFPEIDRIFLHDLNRKSETKLADQITKGSVLDIDTLLKQSDIVFEAASQDAVKAYALDVLAQGKDIIIMSIGSLFDDAFRKKVEQTARKHHAKLYLPSGAVCGIDGILSANVDTIDKVTLVTTKSPKALGKNYKKRTVVFKGTAREAVQKFPKNINVAANLSIAGIGFDKTLVEIVADPVAIRNSHKILAHGRFGRLRAEVENMPNPDNPGSSYLASLSAIATLKRIVNPIQIGA